MSQARFEFKGGLAASKSLMNRALIVQSWYPDLSIEGLSECEDVLHMMKAINKINAGDDHFFDVGDAGTTLRFLVTRLSRQRGSFIVKGSERLFSRPQQDLVDLITQFQVVIEKDSDRSFRIASQGWVVPKELSVNMKKSSQFASGLLLNAWDLSQDLTIKLRNRGHSGSYLQLTIDFLQALGMEIIDQKEVIVVPKNQRIHQYNVPIEPDMSSAFSLAACAVANGSILLQNFPLQSLQPDYRFVDILREAGVTILLDEKKNCLEIEKSTLIYGLDIDLSNNPDLFPVLAVLLSRAEGESRLRGLELLRYKESNRLQKVYELLIQLGFQCQIEEADFLIEGKLLHDYPDLFQLNPDQDHRIAMAAAVAQKQGANIDILNPKVVNKSFPEFWQVIS